MEYSSFRINKDRFWRSLMDMSKIGATSNGGSSRVALTHNDFEGRRLFVQWCQNASMDIFQDEIGNLFCRMAGKNTNVAPIQIGSHLDTQPLGGRFDGVLGVLAGLEIVRTFVDEEYVPEIGIELAVWTNEEGCRFTPSMMGSGVFTGALNADKMLSITDREGITIRQSLDSQDFAFPYRSDNQITGYYELHIEQGPILESERKRIGIVNRGQGERWFDVQLRGSAEHAGTNPMHVRKDPMVAAAKLILEVQDLAKEFGPDAVGTVGSMYVVPNSRNTICGQVDLTVDLRSPDVNQLNQLAETLYQLVDRVCRSVGVAGSINYAWGIDPTIFDKEAISDIRLATKNLDYDFLEMVSGAGHDAFYLSRIAPSAMVFIPCEGGKSHNEAESIKVDDAEAGANVLLHAVLNAIVRHSGRSM